MVQTEARLGRALGGAVLRQEAAPVVCQDGLAVFDVGEWEYPTGLFWNWALLLQAGVSNLPWRNAWTGPRSSRSIELRRRDRTD